VCVCVCVYIYMYTYINLYIREDWPGGLQAIVDELSSRDLLLSLVAPQAGKVWNRFQMMSLLLLFTTTVCLDVFTTSIYY
jgi:hypothetical protein